MAIGIARLMYFKEKNSSNYMIGELPTYVRKKSVLTGRPSNDNMIKHYKV